MHMLWNSIHIKPFGIGSAGRFLFMVFVAKEEANTNCIIIKISINFGITFFCLINRILQLISNKTPYFYHSGGNTEMVTIYKSFPYKY